MRITLIKLTVTLLLPFSTLAAETERQDKPVSGPKPAAVLALAPADALGIAYLARPADLFEHPFLHTAGLRAEPGPAQLLAAAVDTFDGPLMLAVCGSPLNPMSIRVELAHQPAADAGGFFDRLAKSGLPGTQAVPGSRRSETLAEGTLHLVRLPGPIPLTLHAAERRGLIYASTRRSDVIAWLAGEDLPPRFVDSADAGNLTANALAQPDAFAYLNTRGLMPMAISQLERELPGFAAALGLDTLEFAALTAEWARGPLAGHLITGWADPGAGLLNLAAVENRPMDISQRLPADYTFMVRGAWPSAADGIDAINELVAAIDTDIVDEFRTECAEFRREFGFDPHHDLAGNLVDEWMLAARLDAGGNHTPLAVFHVADPALLSSHLRTLIGKFDLEVATRACADGVIHAAPPESGVRLAWAIHDHDLIISHRTEAVCAAITSASEDTTSEPRVALEELSRRLPAESAQFAFLDLSQLAQLALATDGDDPQLADLADTLATLAKTPAGVGVSLRREAAVLALDFTASRAVNTEVRTAFWASVSASLSRSREMAKRVMSASKLRGIVQACLVFAGDHQGTWPESLDQLAEANMLPADALRSPYADEPRASTAAHAPADWDYLYRDGTGLAPDKVVACESSLRQDGANFAFADGHVEWISGARARALLREMRATGQ
jgi:prepilin-type processing-associated H-X9-DG protein